MRFRIKMLLCTVWLLTLSFCLGGTLLITNTFESALAREQDAAMSTWQLLCKTVQLVNDVDTRRDLQGLGATLRQMESTGAWAALRLQQGEQLLYHSGGLDPGEPEIPEDAVHCVLKVFSRDEGHYLQVSGNLIANGRAARMDLVRDISGIYAARMEGLVLYRRLFFWLILASALAAWLMSWLLTRPLHYVTSAARKLARGDLSARVTTRSRDELGELAADFNEMAGRLDESVSELRDSVQRQEQFMGSFAHELKTPMTSIIGYADLLRSQSLSPEESMDAANYIFSEGRRLESLSLKLLDLLVMKHQDFALTQTEMSQLISGLVQHLRPVYAQSGIELQYRCAPGSWPVEPDLIRSLLVNLLDNARKALEQGGNIYIVCEFAEGQCRLRVLDNGRGMPPEAIEHLTEAFYRVDKARARAQGGAGLGLTLCNEIAALHGGWLEFESRVGGGTCVTAVLKGGAA